MRKSLTKRERLKKNSEFRKVFSGSKKYSVEGANLYFISNGLDYNRIGITLSRKFGTSVERNRTKRRIREIYRHTKEDLTVGYDLVILARPGNYSYADRKKQLVRLFDKAKLFKDSP